MSNGCRYRDRYAPAAAGLFCLVWLIQHLFFPGCGKTGQELAIYEITKAGGRVQVDESAPDKPVVRVDFEEPRKTGLMSFGPLGNDGLAHVRPYLEGLPRLHTLRISSWAGISDPGLVQLEGLTQLKTIELYGNRITESGVSGLRKKLSNIQINHYSGGYGF